MIANYKVINYFVREQKKNKKKNKKMLMKKIKTCFVFQKKRKLKKCLERM